MDSIEVAPDCGSCEALCCVVLPFSRSEVFAFDKKAGEACRHLTPAHRCDVHGERVERGLAGCVAFTCYGAGQRATRWFASSPNAVAERADAFSLLKDAHELLWLLGGAELLCPESRIELKRQLRRARLALTLRSERERLGRLNLATWTSRVHGLLRKVGEAVGGREGWLLWRAPLAAFPRDV